MKKYVIIFFTAILFIVVTYEYEKHYMRIMTGYDYDYFAGHPIISRDNIIVVEASVCSYSINKDYILAVRAVEYWRGKETIYTGDMEYIAINYRTNKVFSFSSLVAFVDFIHQRGLTTKIDFDYWINRIKKRKSC